MCSLVCLHSSLSNPLLCLRCKPFIANTADVTPRLRSTHHYEHPTQLECCATGLSFNHPDTPLPLFLPPTQKPSYFHSLSEMRLTSEGRGLCVNIRHGYVCSTFLDFVCSVFGSNLFCVVPQQIPPKSYSHLASFSCSYSVNFKEFLSENIYHPDKYIQSTPKLTFYLKNGRI